MEQKIPKIIHYVWLGSELPSKVQSLMRHNQQYLSNYEIKIWSEQNLPTLSNFAVGARDDKNWAFLSDFVRMKKLKEFGGVYLDTDQKLLRPIDDLLRHSFFAGWNREGTYVYTGIIGATPKNKVIQSVLDQYAIRSYDRSLTSPRLMTECLKNFDACNDIKLYESKYFYPIGADEITTSDKLADAYATHLWNESWVSFRRVRKILRKFQLIKLYKSLKKVF